MKAESFAVGSVSLSLRHFGDGTLTAQAFRAAQVAAGAELEEALQPFAPSCWEDALGSSGTAGAVSQLLSALGHRDGVITPDRLRMLIERCIEAGHVDRLELPGLKADRKPVIAGGLALLYTFAAQFGMTRLAPAKGALRQGVIVELHERLDAQRRNGGATPRGDRRDATVRDMQRASGSTPRRPHACAQWPRRCTTAWPRTTTKVSANSAGPPTCTRSAWWSRTTTTTATAPTWSATSMRRRSRRPSNAIWRRSCSASAAACARSKRS